MRRKTSPAAVAIPVMPLSFFPAKTYIDNVGQKKLGQTVFSHSLIVGEIAKALLANQPDFIRAALFPAGSELIAASHDLGKISPTFVVKLLQAVGDEWQQTYPQLVKFVDLTQSEKSWGGHAGVSALSLAALGYNNGIDIVAAQHHGSMPQASLYPVSAEQFGGDAWQHRRKELLAALATALGAELPQSALNEAQIIALSGLTCVADWIGSGSRFDDPAISWQHNIQPALKQAGFVPFSLQPGLTFQDAFGFAPRQAQQVLIDNCQRPGVYVLEAPPGDGKTEAALYCAYQLLAKGQASGIYFALPTQLTSNKIHERFTPFLHAILIEDCPHKRALLLHGKAWLEHTEMGEEGMPGNSWYSSAKRGMLAPFSVGTIDQALMAAMNVRHGFVRAFGLMGKVVILDEVHSYDAYTSVILDRLIALLRSLHCTVIILSATLNRQRKQELLGVELQENAYPLITRVSPDELGENKVIELPVTPPPERQVVLKEINQDQLAMDEAIDRAMAGQQVLWIENTVAQAQQRYECLAARCHENGLAIGLLHSRFTFEDRARNEARWVNAFGKAGWDDRAAQGRILIGTQVLEQSLDIDADFLITRFCVTDMLLQRLGRLWRHADTPRALSACCEAWFLAPSLQDAINDPETAFGDSRFIYSSYLLCRSLMVWQPYFAENQSLCLPTDIRALIDETYQEQAESDAMAKWKKQLYQGDGRNKGLDALRQLARVTLSKAGKAQADTSAQTRYSEEDSAELVIVSAIRVDSEAKQTHIQLLNGDALTLPWSSHKLTPEKRRSLSALLQRQTAPCRLAQITDFLVSPSRARQLGFGHVFYLGDANYPAPFALAMRHADGKLRSIDGQLANKEYLYRADKGLQTGSDLRSFDNQPVSEQDKNKLDKALKADSGLRGTDNKPESNKDANHEDKAFQLLVNAENQFNLIDEPWIPIIDHGLASLREVFSAFDYRALGGTPVEKIALTKFLLAITQAAVTPKNQAEWEALSTPCMAQRCLDYLEKWHGAFYLYGESPFLQFPQITSAELKPFGAILPDVATGNTSVLTQFHSASHLDNSQKSVLLIVQMAMALGGKKTDNRVVLTKGYKGKANDKGKPGTAKPGTGVAHMGLLHSFAVGSTLLDTLRFNLLTQEEINSIALYAGGVGKAPWEQMPEGEDCARARELKTTLMGRLIPLNRFCLFTENGVHLTEGLLHLSHKEGLFDPSITTKQVGKEIKAIWCEPERRPWRHLTALLGFIAPTTGMGSCIGLQYALPKAANDAAQKGDEFGIWSGGISVSSNAGEQYVSGKDDVVESLLLLPHNSINKIWFSLYCKEIAHLERLAKILYGCVQRYFAEFKKDGKNQAASATLFFWQRCEQDAQALLMECEDAEKREIQRQKFRCYLMAAFDMHCPNHTARQLDAWAKCRPFQQKITVKEKEIQHVVVE